jgi:hypothetical protein
LITSAIGQDIFNLNRINLDNLYQDNTYPSLNISKYAWDHRWQGSGTSNYYPAPSTIGATGSGYRKAAPRSFTSFSDFEVEKGSYVRLKNVSLSYNLHIQKNRILKTAKVFINATNLFIITKYTGYDPEVSASANKPISPGIDNGTIPQHRDFSFGINVGF